MPRVGLLWRTEWDPPNANGSITDSSKLRDVFMAFAALGVPAEPVIYSDDDADAVRDQLLTLDGVLVWVNPLEQGLDRSRLDPLLREVADAGVWVSAHPDVIIKVATKQVLVDTNQMSWGTQTKLYTALTAELRRRSRRRDLSIGTGLELKQNPGLRGNGCLEGGGGGAEP